MSEIIRSYRDLRVWQQAVDYCVQLYEATSSFPGTETYGLTAQIRRAAVSIPSNIAEGYGRSNRDFGRYLQMAMGVLAEVETQMEIAYRVNYLSDDEYSKLVNELTAIGKQLNVLLHRVQATNPK